MDRHDPLCPYVAPPDYRAQPTPCQCDLIARVRADERRRVEMNTVIDREPLIDMIDELVQQACYMPPEGMGEAYLDSMALSVYADAMRFLALEGRIKITQEYGRRVIAERIREA